MISRMSLTSEEQYVFKGDDTRVQVVVVFFCFLRVVRLHLRRKFSFFFFELQNVAFIPFIRRNLISVPFLDRLGYSLLFGIGKVNLYRDSLLFDNGTLCGNLYKLELYSLIYFSLIVNTVSSTKHLRLNEKSYILCHKCLGHISKQKMKRLIKDEILPALDFSVF